MELSALMKFTHINSSMYIGIITNTNNVYYEYTLFNIIRRVLSNAMVILIRATICEKYWELNRDLFFFNGVTRDHVVYRQLSILNWNLRKLLCNSSTKCYQTEYTTHSKYKWCISKFWGYRLETVSETRAHVGFQHLTSHS